MKRINHKNNNGSSIYKPNDLSGFISSTSEKSTPKSVENIAKTKKTIENYTASQLWEDVRKSYYDFAIHKNKNKFIQETDVFCLKFSNSLEVTA